MMDMELKKRSAIIPLVIFTLLFCFLYLVYMKTADSNLKSDERGYSSYIYGVWKNPVGLCLSSKPTPTTLPTYCLLAGFLEKILGSCSIARLRFYSLLVGFGAILLFYATYCLIDRQWALLRTLQFCFIPIILPFFFLIYPEILSLLLVLLMVHFSIRKNLTIAGLLGSLSILIRQDNVLWVAAFFVWNYSNGSFLKFGKGRLANYFRSAWTFLVGIAFFCIFVFLNDGVALGDRTAHPQFKFFYGNIYMALFLFFIIFLPLQAYYSKKIGRFMTNRKGLSLLLIFLPLFFMTYNNMHPYNNKYGIYVRNIILFFVHAGYLPAFAYFIVIFYGLCSVCVARLRLNAGYCLYPAAIIFLGSHWLIEPRYYMVPLLLFMLFREKTSVFCEIMLLINLMAGSAFILMVHYRTNYFL